jgi:uncharacterized protein (TIGR02246 family)
MSGMQSHRTIIAALATFLPAVVIAQSTAADTQAIRDLIAAHAIAWNHRDANAAAAIMTPDAVWITSSGITLHGRAEIERAHRQWLAEDSAAGSSTHVHPPESIRIQFLRPDVAVADLGTEFRANPKPGEATGAVDRGSLFIVVTKDGDAWHIAEVRNTVSPPK